MDARLVFVVSISPPLVRPTRRLSRTYLQMPATSAELLKLATACQLRLSERVGRISE
ncbi:hypothetical protein ABD440_06905 [Chromobacterium piscinae]|uniref:hypothetical protein n=1 Tax=Chromobacterium piscinae TaxID=686831 RepID=UPI0031FBA8E2